MMSRKRLYLLLIILMLFGFSTRSDADEVSGKKVLIVYETETLLGYDMPTVNHLNQLLYVFNEKVDTVSIHDYHSKAISAYDAIFVINMASDLTNRDFLRDLSECNVKIYWIGDRIESFLECSDQYDLKYHSQNNNINTLHYKNNTFFVSESNSFNRLSTSRSAHILASMNDGFHTYPYILNEKNLYYIAKWNPKDSYIFEDSLNDFYEKKDFPVGEILVRIGEVQPFTDLTKLQQVADYLAGENVPFMISVVPYEQDAKTGELNMLALKPEFLETINEMIKKGGSVVLSGGDDPFNMFVLENLGTINPDDPFTIDRMKENFNKLSLVRGYRGGFCFSPETDVKYLREYIDFLKAKKVSFLDLEQKENPLKIEVSPEKSQFEKQIKTINDIVISFIAIILVLFFIIFIVFKVMNRRKFTRR